MDAVKGSESSAAYDPVVRLEVIQTTTGEEEEANLFKQRCVLYRFDPSGPEWKERGRGEIKIMQHKTTGKCRVILREGKTFKLRLNHGINQLIELVPNGGSDRSWTWSTTDFSEGCGDEGTEHTFAIKFKDSNIAQSYKKQYDECRDIMKQISEGSYTIPENLGQTSDEGKAEGKAEAKAEAKAEDAAAATEAATQQAETENIWLKLVNDHNYSNKMSNEDLKKVFANYDADNNGFIDGKELEKLCVDVLKAMCASVELDESSEFYVQMSAEVPLMSQRILANLDENADNKLSFEEFTKLKEINALLA
jgi:Ran-binding protein 1